MSTLNIIAAHNLPSPSTSSFAAQSHKPNSLSLFFCTQASSKPDPPRLSGFPTRKKRSWIVGSVTEDREVVPLKEKLAEEQDSRLLVNGSEEFQALSTSSEEKGEGDDLDKLTSRAINALIVLGFGTFAVSKLLTIDHDYWHGWTLYEILRYVPEHNWIAYEQALKANPVFAKMVISGVVYTLGDWIAQCFEGKPLLDFDRKRMFRSGLVGFTFHGSLSHFYYQFCEALFPLEDWWVVPAKIAFDQTVWSAIWNSIYFVVLGFLRFESPTKIFDELRATFVPMLTAGWKLWPFAHVVTYGLIPVEQRLLWVDCVELIWVTILSTFSNENADSSLSEASSGADSASSSSSSSKSAPPGDLVLCIFIGVAVNFNRTNPRSENSLAPRSRYPFLDPISPEPGQKTTMAKVEELRQESKDATVAKNKKKRSHGSTEFFVFDYVTGSGPSWKNFTGVGLVEFRFHKLTFTMFPGESKKSCSLLIQ
ncbi:hypothetical protein EV1_045050 [Malus domestica]